ncbi:hypothetical protein [Arenimonas metalli]|nr:hypothetical protein [Arenimonas metalli]
MNDDDVRKMLLRSSAMTAREQAVWAAVFARSEAFDLGAAVQADEAVKALRRIDPDELGPTTPEHQALAAGTYISEGEFGPWYRVAWRLAMRGSKCAMEEVTSQQIESAYDAYLRGQGDFY